MTKNKCASRSEISEANFRELERLFSLNLEAIQLPESSTLNRNTDKPVSPRNS